MEQQLSKRLLELEKLCTELMTSDTLRNAELRNIAQIVTGIREEILENLVEKAEADDGIEEVTERLKFLAANPKSAGKHELARNTRRQSSRGFKFPAAYCQNK
jgi:hypothetical protein